MGVGVRIVSKNLNPEPGLRPTWRQETMTETLSVGKLTQRVSAGSVQSSSRRRRRRRRVAGVRALGGKHGETW